MQIHYSKHIYFQTDKLWQKYILTSRKECILCYAEQHWPDDNQADQVHQINNSNGMSKRRVVGRTCGCSPVNSTYKKLHKLSNSVYLSATKIKKKWKVLRCRHMTNKCWPTCLVQHCWPTAKMCITHDNILLDNNMVETAGMWSRSRRLETYQRLISVSVSDLCISDLVLVSTQNVSASRLGSGTISSCRDISCRRTQLNYNSPMKTSRPMPYSVGR